MTLVHQGGPMGKEEAEEFEKKDNLQVLIRSRHWDEEAKVAGLNTPPMQFYQEMFAKYMENILS